MTRRLLAVLLAAVAGATPVTAAPAPPEAYVVHEVYRVRAGGPAQVSVRVRVTPGKAEHFVMSAGLQPRAAGGWTVFGAAMTRVYEDDTTWRTYGWPAGSPPACPHGDLCGARTEPKGPTTATLTFNTNTVTRFVVAGPRGRLSVTSLSSAWRVRPSTATMRTVLAEQAKTTGFVSSAGRYELFQEAAAAGGAYGSLVYGQPPCDTRGGGMAHLSPGGDTVYYLGCDGGFADAPGAATWRFTGPTFGEFKSRFRLAVLSFPRR